MMFNPNTTVCKIQAKLFIQFIIFRFIPRDLFTSKYLPEYETHIPTSSLHILSERHISRARGIHKSQSLLIRKMSYFPMNIRIIFNRIFINLIQIPVTNRDTHSVHTCHPFVQLMMAFPA